MQLNVVNSGGQDRCWHQEGKLVVKSFASTNIMRRVFPLRPVVAHGGRETSYAYWKPLRGTTNKI